MLYHGTFQHISMVSWLVPTSPSDLNRNVHEASSKFLSTRFFFRMSLEAFYIIFNSRRHSYMEAGYNHVPCCLSSFSSGDIQGIGGWAKLNKSTTVSTFEILASKGRTTEMLFLWRTL